MTPEPAQPAESPEARAEIVQLRKAGTLLAGALERIASRRWNGKPDAVAIADEALFATSAMLAASTARPTERGAVEAMREALEVAKRAIMNAAKDTLWCDDTPAETVVDRIDALLAEVDGQQSFALTPPVTVAATDQGGEVELRALLQAKIRAGHCLDDSEEGDVNFCGECNWCLHILADRALAANHRVGVVEPLRDALESIARPFPAKCNWEDQARACQIVAQQALATQPATGRTMGGEVEAAASMALMYLQTGVMECERCGFEISTADLDATYELAAVVKPASDAALQNGGE